jgi:hypothetical protein
MAKVDEGLPAVTVKSSLKVVLKGLLEAMK